MLFTKCDRLQFFLEYARNLGPEEAQQVLGATLPMVSYAGGVYAEQETARVSQAFDHLFASLADKRPTFLSREFDETKLPAIYEFPREFRKLRVARGYLVGSGWKDYQKTGTVCGIALPPGLRESDALPEPIFTPATKAVTGHDENISFDEMVKIVGAADAAKLHDLTVGIYKKAADYARTRGIIIADTKFEFGRVGGQIVLADEVLTPDSSRFWPADQYAPGRAQPSYDKQFVRDYLESIKWNKQPPAPELPEDIAAKTSNKYKDAYRELTGRELPGSNQQS